MKPQTLLKKLRKQRQLERQGKGRRHPPDNAPTPARPRRTRTQPPKPTDHEHPSRPATRAPRTRQRRPLRKLEARARAARWTHKANQPNTAEKPKADTTEEGRGEGRNQHGKDLKTKDKDTKKTTRPQKGEKKHPQPQPREEADPQPLACKKIILPRTQSHPGRGALHRGRTAEMRAPGASAVKYVCWGRGDRDTARTAAP